MVSIHPQVEEILRRYLHACQRVFPRHFRSGCCIAATRVGMRVLGEAYRLRVQPLCLLIEAANNPHLRWQECWREHDPTEAEVEQARGEGAWEVVLGEPETPGDPSRRWAGHLALLVQGQAVVDASAGQMARLEKGLPVAPLLVPVTAEFAEGETVAQCRYDWGLLRVRALPEMTATRGWYRAKDWQERHRTDACVREVRERMALQRRK